MGIMYRPEIDGLRAVAVSAVVLHHAGIGGAGFVGVDVFFVISGYLITALLLREYANTGRIDLPAFYARRVRRIFPAAIAVLGAVLLAALLVPAYARQPIMESAGWASLFGANVFFQLTTGGYFDASTEQMPLLHLWSLAVEEQFYFLWPAALIVLLKSDVRLPRVLAYLAAASFMIAEWLMIDQPEAAFYQMPARFWELAAGGIIAALPARSLPRYVAPAGLLLTLAACIWPLGHFPGIGALPAVLGACLVIASLHGGSTSRLLASRPFVAVGLISYSLYLWHWPLLAIDRLLRVGPSPLETRIALLVVSVMLAAVSYRYIETPFRRASTPRWRLIGVGASASLAVALCAFTFATNMPPALDPASVAANDSPLAFIKACAYQQDEAPEAFPRPGCSPTAASRITLWGDSMAISLQPMVLALDSKAGSYTRAGCPPFVGFTKIKPAEIIAGCVAFNNLVAERARGKSLYLVARWDYYPGFAQGLRRTLEKVSPRFNEVVIVGPTPILRDRAPQCLLPGAADCSILRADFDAKNEPIWADLRQVAGAFANVRVLDPSAFFCDSHRCAVTKDGYSLYIDAHHISQTAARAYGRELAAVTN